MMLGAFLVVAFCMPMISFGWWYWEDSITIFRVLSYYSHMTIFNIAAAFGLVGFILGAACLVLGFIICNKFKHPKATRATKILVISTYAITFIALILWIFSSIGYNRAWWCPVDCERHGWPGRFFAFPYVGIFLLSLSFIELIVASVIYLVKRKKSPSGQEEIKQAQPQSKEKMLYGGLELVVVLMIILELLLPMVSIDTRREGGWGDPWLENFFTHFVSRGFSRSAIKGFVIVLGFSSILAAGAVAFYSIKILTGNGKVTVVRKIVYGVVVLISAVAIFNFLYALTFSTGIGPAFWCPYTYTRLGAGGYLLFVPLILLVASEITNRYIKRRDTSQIGHIKEDIEKNNELR
ncbi:MAG: hypothetical protein FWE22_04400 [Firmicutes bacterium]|nr:hypothetical protein [Bacillota bacterium]